MGMLALLAGVGLALANGANDNCKGVATLIGGRVISQVKALRLAHATTFLGCLASVLVARGLIHAFQGNGMLPEELAGDRSLLTIVGAAAAATILLATWLRLPVSTTHALIGALVGAGLGASGTVLWGGLLSKFLIPLLLSPLVGAVLAGGAYRVLHRLRLAMGVSDETCVCVGESRAWIPVRELAGAAECDPSLGSGLSACVHAQAGVSAVSVHVGREDECRQRYQGQVLGVSAASLLDTAHGFSASLTSFARGMNDAPKLAAIVIGITAWSSAGPAVAIGLVAVAMAVGGILGARRVEPTMSEGITSMNAGSAATANGVAAVLVIMASLWALPVSTTHVTCGAIFGIGAAHRQARGRMIGGILLAWGATLPVAALIALGLTALL